MWTDPDRLTIEVDDGDVKLYGQVDTQIQAELAAKLAGRVPGVVSVASGLSWNEDGNAR
jgi:osmotically-inducible protein OsmY